MQHRVTAVVNDDDFERIKYWASRKDMSINEFVRYSIDLTIKRENKDYDLPSLEANRLNQLIDVINALSFNVGNLEHIVSSGFDSLLRMTRGENYLMDDEKEYEVSNDLSEEEIPDGFDYYEGYDDSDVVDE